MADNVVSFFLQAKDDVSSVLARLRGEFKKTEDTYRDTQGRLRTSNGRFASDAVKGFSGINLAWQGLVEGFGAGIGFKALDFALAKIGSLGTAFNDAARAQTLMIATSSDVGTNLGIGIKAARDVVDGLQGDIARVAGELPGVTKDYNEVFTGIGGSLARLFAGDTEGFKNAAKEITTRVGILGAIRGISGTESGSAVNRLLSGTMGFGEARQLDLFQKNPMLQVYLQNVAAQKGLDLSQIQKWSMKERYEVIATALKLAAPDTLINEFKGTAESILQTWQTNLFDPIVGIFGLSRKVVSRANKTALDAYTNLLQQMDILAQAFGGLGFDPMSGLIDFLDWLSYGVARLTSLKQQGTDLFSLDSVISFFRSLDVWTVQAINATLTELKGVLDNIDWVQAGRTLFTLALGGLVNLGKTLASINWGDVANVLVAGVAANLKLMYGFIEQGFKSLLDVFKGWIDGLKGFFSDPTGFIKSLFTQAPATAPDNSGSLFSDKPAVSLPDIKTDNGSKTNFLFQPSVSVTANTGATAEDIAQKVMGAINDRYEDYRRQWAF